MCLRYICTDIPSVCWCSPVNRFIHPSDISGFQSKAEINHRPSCESHLRITKRRRLLRPFYPQFGLLQSGISRHGQRSDRQHHCHSQTPQLLARIAADPRHTHLVVLSQEDEIRERLFPEWDMELVEAADIREVLNDALEQSADDKQKRMLSQMLLEIESGGLTA